MGQEAGWGVRDTEADELMRDHRIRKSEAEELARTSYRRME